MYKVFKGTASEYRMLHLWVEKTLGKPDSCSNCHKSWSRFEWANISGEYRKEVTDWEKLCTSCHRRKDSHGNPNTCKYGHPMTSANTYTYPNRNSTECISCRQLRRKGGVLK